MCVEPDGAVIPCQSYYEPLGDILRDPWEAIWNHDLARGLRERSYAPKKCRECAEFAICGGGCPLYLRHEEGRGNRTVAVMEDEEDPASARICRAEGANR